MRSYKIQLAHFITWTILAACMAGISLWACGHRWSALGPYHVKAASPHMASSVSYRHAIAYTHTKTLGGIETASIIPRPTVYPQGSYTIHLPSTIYLPLVLLEKTPRPPAYHLTVAPEDLAWLYDPDNLWTHETVPATFKYKDTAYDVQVRFRGGTVRYLPKKSWKIDFPATSPFQGQRELNLNAEYTDKSLIREVLAYDLFRLANLSTPDTQFIRLYLNDQYMGVFVQVEQVDKRFLHRIGWDPNGNLYKGDYGGNFEWRGLDAVESYVNKTNPEDSHDDIMALLWLITITSDADFPAAITSVIDVGRYLDWYTVQVVIGNYEWLEKNYYIYHDLNHGFSHTKGLSPQVHMTRAWAFLPWDLDLTLGHNWGVNGILDRDITWDNPIDAGTKNSPKIDGIWNQLITRVLDVEAFRFAYCRRLQAMLHDEFTEATLFPRIDAYHGYITPHAEADSHKWGSNEEFHNGPDELKTYITQRRAWLSDQATIYCPTKGPMPRINEFMPVNTTSITDEAGDYDPWIELYNPGLVSFDAGGMVLHHGQTGTLTLQWSIPEDTLIPAKGFLLIWADGEPDEGPLHTNFRLAASGPQTHTLRLMDKALYDHALVDQKTYNLKTGEACENSRPILSSKSSEEGKIALGECAFGYINDGANPWDTCIPPTPGGSNLGRAPTISQTRHMPREPRAGHAVTVTTMVHLDRASAVSVTLHWGTGGEAYRTPMYTETSSNNDGSRSYMAQLPSLNAGTYVSYYIQAHDNRGLIQYDPPDALPHTARMSRPYEYIVGFTRPPLFINELVAINQDTLDDEAGESADWFEIYNAGPDAIDLSGMYLTDAIENTTKWQIPNDVVAPSGGYVVFWADNEPDEGPTHVNFKLDGDGERLALYASEASYNGLIDEVYYGPQHVDQAFGRYPDGIEAWRFLSPTPGQANRQPAPRIGYLDHIPPFPMAGQDVTIQAHIQDEGHILTATLYYAAVALTSTQGYKAIPMRPISGDVYQAPIPAQPEGTLIHYYVQAWDNLLKATRFPAAAPSVTYGYQTTGATAPPPVVINEFLASNDTVNHDERGEYEDWVELYHTGIASDTHQDLGNLYLTDDLSKPNKWRVPEGTSMAPGTFLIIWTDDDEADTSDGGPLHTNFKLSKTGEAIGLFQHVGLRSEVSSNVYLRIDHFVFQQQATDISTGRSPDGSHNWRTFDPPTPAQSNAAR